MAKVRNNRPMIRQSRRDLPKDNTNSLEIEVLRYDMKKGVKSEEKEGVEELKRNVKKRVKRNSPPN